MEREINLTQRLDQNPLYPQGLAEKDFSFDYQNQQKRKQLEHNNFAPFAAWLSYYSLSDLASPLSFSQSSLNSTSLENDLNEYQHQASKPKDSANERNQAQAILAAKAASPEITTQKTIHSDAANFKELLSAQNPIFADARIFSKLGDLKVVTNPRTGRPVNLDVEFLSKQIVDQIKLIRSKEKIELLITLKPEHLGNVRLSISVTGGEILIKIISSLSAKDVLETHQQQLIEALEKANLKVGSFNVSVGESLGEQQRREEKPLFYLPLDLEESPIQFLPFTSYSVWDILGLKPEYIVYKEV